MKKSSKDSEAKIHRLLQPKISSQRGGNHQMSV